MTFDIETETATEFCYCTNENCPKTHPEEDPEACIWEFWFKGERSDTLAYGDDEKDVISDILYLSEDHSEVSQWVVKNLVTKQKWAGDKFFAEHPDLVAQCAA